MSVSAFLQRWASLVWVTVVVGCASKSKDQPTAHDEGVLRAKFAELQSAIKNRDAEKLWALLDTKSRGDAERAAIAIQTAYNQAGDAEKAKQEKALGLSGTELPKLDAKDVLKSKRFLKKYHEQRLLQS